MRADGRKVAVVLAAMAMALTAGVAHAAQPLGTLTQLSGTAGCFTYNGNSEDGAGTCTQARGTAQGESAIVSPDGKNVYAGSYAGASLGAGFAVFSRNQSTGALTQLSGTAGCLTSDGSSSAGAGTCIKARGLVTRPGDGHDVAVTSDGRWAYIVAQNSSTTGAVMLFQRDPSTGALTQLGGTAGCITPDGSSQDGAGTCQTDATLSEPMGTAISSDDRFLYVTDYGITHRLHVFARNTTTGALTDVQCLSEAPAPTGCTTGRTLGDSEYLALSPNGSYAYSGDYYHGLSIFNRDSSTGLLTQKAGTAGCITSDGNDDAGNSTCAVGRQVKGTYPVLIAPNGNTLYNIDANDGGFSVFHINADGTLSQLSGTAGCVTIDGKDSTGASTCTTARAVDDVYGGALSPDGRSLYVSNNSFLSGGVAIFSLDQSAGAATQLSGLQGCITSDGKSNGTAGQCTDGRALSEGYGMSVSPDGNSVYQATDGTTTAGGLAVYSRETAPTCQSTGVMTAAGRSVTVPLSCTDVDGDAVTRSIVSGPAHGSLSAISAGNGTVTYTPSSGFSGNDSFTFAASDGVNSSAPATATITVGPRPAVSSLRVSPSRFSLAGRKLGGRCVKPTSKTAGKPPCRRPIRFRVSFKLNVATGVGFTIKRAALGRKVPGRCVKPTAKNRTHPSCTRFVSLRGKITLTGKLGANHFTFKGKIGGHKLGPGTYQLIATPTGGTPSKVKFKLLP